MNRLVNALKATYDFFAGDAIILTIVVLGFIVTALLTRLEHASSLLTGIVFIVFMGSGLVITLVRERAGRQRQR